MYSVLSAVIKKISPIEGKAITTIYLPVITTTFSTVVGNSTAGMKSTDYSCLRLPQPCKINKDYKQFNY